MHNIILNALVAYVLLNTAIWYFASVYETTRLSEWNRPSNPWGTPFRQLLGYYYRNPKFDGLPAWRKYRKQRRQWKPVLLVLTCAAPILLASAGAWLAETLQDWAYAAPRRSRDEDD